MSASAKSRAAYTDGLAAKTPSHCGRNSLSKPDTAGLAIQARISESEEMLGILNSRAQRAFERAARLRGLLGGVMRECGPNEVPPPFPSMEAPLFNACIAATQDVEEAIKILEEIEERLAL